MKQWKHICLKWNEFIKRILRKESIFKRLNLSFLGLLLGAAAFITFFSFDKYSKECLKWNEFIKRILRKESIFKRLNLSFLGLLLGAAAFITFFSFDKYSKEIIWNLKQNAAMQVQNICLKMEDIMREYEDVALQFYDDARVLQAAVENAEADQNGEKGKEDNIALIEEKLYTMSRQRKHIKNVQFVTPGRQYHMMEKHGYPVGFEDAGQSETFYETEQSVYGFGSIVTLGVAVYDPYTREFLGVLFININIEAFEAAADGYEGGPEGYGFGSIVTLGVAVYDPYTREFLGVLFININIEAFEAAADGYEGGPEGYSDTGGCCL